MLYSGIRERVADVQRVFGIFMTSFLLVALVATQMDTAQAQLAPEVDVQVEEAVLAEDWAKVAELLDSVDPETPSPVARLIKGHACLALNRNNESLCLFLSILTEDSLQVEHNLQLWAHWTQKFVSENPNAMMAHYLRGDAFARSQKWEEALKAFNHALELEPNHPIILNARGVSYAAIGQWDSSREDLKKATEVTISLAELYASRGTYILQRRTDAKKASEWFNRALEISPRYILALNGRAAAQIVLRNWDQAAIDVDKAKALDENCLFAAQNIVNLNAAILTGDRNEAVSEMIAQLTGIEPGFSLQEKISMLDNMSPMERQRAFDIVNNAGNFNNRIQGSWAVPNHFDLGMTGGLKASIIGPQAYLEAHGTGTWDIKGTSSFNLNHQTDLMDVMKGRYGMTHANNISNLSAWWNQHMVPGGDFGKLTSPKGVSSREIGDEPVDTGEWNVFTMYGLLYHMKLKDASSRD